MGEPPAQVSFTVAEEFALEEMLKKAKGFLQIIAQSMPTTAPEPRKPKLGMEHIYQFTPNGKLELFRLPKLGVHAIFLALYCYDPDSASVDQLVGGTGLVKNSVTGFLSQKPYNGYVRRVGESLFRLSFEGKKWVVTEILRNLGVEMPALDSEMTDEE